MVGSNIRGISEASLWESWKEVRRQLKRAPQRDTLDHLEYDVDPSVWIKRTISSIRSGEYSPERPSRCSVAKSKGFDRIITVPSVPDVVLYRTIVDLIYRKARSAEVKHAYFSQSTLSKVVKVAQNEAIAAVETSKVNEDAGYPVGPGSVFLEWLKYDQYRKLLIFDKVYPFIVITDISNFFDSVLYSKIEESIIGLRISGRLSSLLFHMLESFSLREDMTPVQRIGLPVDPCDCSRVLAHLVLFSHDKRMVARSDADAYVRWMDDQNIGVSSYADGMRMLGYACDSLRKLHLTPNSSKSKVLSLKQAKEYFHFNANADLDKIDGLPSKSGKERKAMRSALRRAWLDARTLEGVGEWQKILKRFYRVAAQCNSRMFVNRAHSDLIEMPALTERILDYMRYVSTPERFVDFVGAALAKDEQVYKEVGYQLVDGLLRVSPDKATSKRILVFALKLLDKKVSFCGSEDARSLAPLLVLRFGDGRNLNGLKGRLGRAGDGLSSGVVRALCAVIGGSKRAGFKVVQSTASKLLRNHLSDFVKLIVRVKSFSSVPGRFKARLALSKDSITGMPYIDMRSVLAARILGLSSNKLVKSWLSDTRKAHLSSELSDFDKAMIRRLWPKADHSK